MLACCASILHDCNRELNWVFLGILSCIVFFLYPIQEYKFSPKQYTVTTQKSGITTKEYATAVYSKEGVLLGALTDSQGLWRLELPHHKLLKLVDAVNSKGKLRAATNMAVPGYEKYIIALTMLEDKKFWGHLGIDSWAIARAIKDNFLTKRIASGASTLTMQTSRLLYNNQPRTIVQKFKEALLAIKLELLHGKTGVIASYANIAPFGGNVVGLETAMFRWYGRDLEDATWAEAAVLALLPNNPGNISLETYRDVLLSKRNALLEKLYKNKIIDRETYELSLLETLPEKAQQMPSLAYHYTEAMRKQYGGGAIATSLNARIQEQAVAVVNRYARQFELYGINNIAAVIINIHDKSFVAYIGNATGKTPVPAGYVDCARAPRSSGSILKPFLYAAMLTSGELTPGKLIPDIPTHVGSYSPENMFKTYTGAIRADRALANSLNIPFVRLLRSYGVERFGLLLKRLGFTTLTRALDDYGLPLIVGGAEVNLVDAVQAYAELAQSALENNHHEFSQGAAWLTLQALIKVKRPQEEALWEEFVSKRNIAWKTGTSYGNRDAWSIGVTKDYVVGVWVGNATGEGRPELVSTRTAAPILFELFALLPESTWFDEPYNDLQALTVCAESGYPASPNCKHTVMEYVPKSAQIDAVCPYCRTVCLTKDGKWRTNLSVSKLDEIHYEQWFVLPPVMEYYYAKLNPTYKPLPPLLPSIHVQNENPMQFIVPEEHAKVYIPIELDGTPGKIVFSLVHRTANCRVFWHLDGEFLGETTGEHKLEARPGKGFHELTVVDEQGNSLTVTFEVYSEK